MANETQKLRGRPVTNPEAVEAAMKLIDMAFKNDGPRPRFSIPVQFDDTDVLLMDYLREVEETRKVVCDNCKAEGRLLEGSHHVLVPANWTVVINDLGYWVPRCFDCDRIVAAVSKDALAVRRDAMFAIPESSEIPAR